MLRKIVLTALMLLTLTTGYCRVSQHTADSIADILNRQEALCDKSCPLYNSESHQLGLTNTIFIDLLVAIGTLWLYSNKKKKYFFIIGGVIVLTLTGSQIIGHNKAKPCAQFEQTSCPIVNKNATGKTAALASADEQSSDLSDFEQADDQSNTQSSDLSDFEQVDDQSNTQSSDLSDFEQADDQSSTQSSDLSDFEQADNQNGVPQVSVGNSPSAKTFSITDPNIFDPLATFLVLMLVAVGLRNKNFSKYRGLFLLAGVAWLGFYRGICTCMIGSFQNLVLNLASWHFYWPGLLWIAVLLPASYLFGRVWCGWLCPMGGIQEFLFHSPKLNILTSEKSQKTLRIVRYVVFIVWVLQLLVTQTNLYCSYDPFKTLFNLVFTGPLSVVLLLILLITSVLIYRPFCRMVCPVGVLLGWVSKIPGARNITVKSDCINCKVCNKKCSMHAIVNKDKAVVDTETCIYCGECKANCNKDSIK
jgi:NAD-dependent dihydropyrimidine dehydrogenase PreA subunit